MPLAGTVLGVLEKKYRFLELPTTIYQRRRGGHGKKRKKGSTQISQPVGSKGKRSGRKTKPSTDER